ncbi:MAG: flagellar biosynthetic protein FliO [Anaeromyxobacteraceae bacterium]
MSVPLPAPAAALQGLAQPAAAALPGWASLLGPVAVLLLLAAAVVVLRRRRGAPTRRLQILESASLGPKRSLVLARLGDELLLLGSTDAGIALLRAQHAGAAEPPELVSLRAAELAEAAPPAPARPGAALVDIATRLVPHRRRKADPRSPAFEALLAESSEDQELRQKLARGLTGSVR